MFANEEQGLVGAKAYAAAHKHELSNIITGAESEYLLKRIMVVSKADLLVF